MSDRFWWFAVRSTGLVSWAMFAISMLVGGLLAARLIRRPASIRRAVGVHRHASALGLGLTAIHLAALFGDSFVDFSISDLFVPFASDWRPRAVAWGIGAMYVMVAVEVTSLCHRRVSRRTWKMVHRLSAVGFAAATLHLLQAGSDAQAAPIRGTVMTWVMVLAFLYFGRPLGLFGRDRPATVEIADPLRANESTLDEASVHS